MQVAIQLIKALRNLHRLGYAHCDIKPENICVKLLSKQNDNLMIKMTLIDFGLSSKIVN